MLLKKYLNRTEEVSLAIDDEEFLSWRLAKPGQHYEKLGNTIVKKYQDSYDIVYLGKNFPEELRDDKLYNLLVDADITDLTNDKVFHYQYGYRWFNHKFSNIPFKKDLLISDVF